MNRTILPLALLAVLFFAAPSLHAAPLPFTGVNLAGGEFGNPQPDKPSIYGKNFVYPSTAELDYFIGKGVNVIRFPFQWPILQPEAKKPLNPAEIERYKKVVTEATDKGLIVLLDPHNYARYYGKVVGGADVPNDVLADFWGRMAAQFKDNPRVWFGLMNEPYDMPTDQWRDAANGAIAAIRQTGAKNLILVPGNGWTSASGWADNHNDTAMLKIHDPANHYIFEVHTYLDSDSSGTKPVIVSPTVGVERLQKFTLWCRKNHQRAFLGEFGAAASPEAKAAVENMLSFMEGNRDVWVGFTWWAAGAWWGEYMFSVEPKSLPPAVAADRPQMGYLQPHLHGITPPAKRKTL